MTMIEYHCERCHRYVLVEHVSIRPRGLRTHYTYSLKCGHTVKAYYEPMTPEPPH